MVALTLMVSLLLPALNGATRAMQTPPAGDEAAPERPRAERDRAAAERDDTGANRNAGQPVIVSLAPGADPAAVARDLGVTPEFVYEEAINGFAATLPPRAVEALQRSRSTLRITPDLPVEADIQDEVTPDGTVRDDRRRQRQRVPTGVNRIDADTNELADINRDGGVVDADVAVLDTGIAAHPELNIAGGKSCRPRGGSRDFYGHGTHVAGTIGARDNRKGVVGVAPGVRLWAVKVLNDNGSGSFGSVICGLDWVLATQDTANEIDLVNMSLGGDGAESICRVPPSDPSYDPFHEAVCDVVDAGVTVVVSAGNDREDASSQVPANFDEVITVSAMHDFNGRPGGGAKPACLRNAIDDTFASNYSNFGADVGIMAPGSCIRSTWLDKQYQVLTGTSMAAPYVAGAAALYIAENQDQDATPADVRTWLLTPNPPGASRPQNDPAVGLRLVDSGDPDAFPEPILYLGDT